MSGKPQRRSAKLENPSGEDTDGFDEPMEALGIAVGLQAELDVLSEKCAEEILQVEQKYNSLKRPFFEQRRDLLKRVPLFWFNVLVNHPQLQELITAEDEEVLISLQSIEVEEDEDMKSGLRIHFNFAGNDYFENKVLTKEYLVDPNTSEPICKPVEIKWKPGKDLSVLSRGTAVMVAGTKRNHEDSSSFFQWFYERQPASEDPMAEILKEEIWPNPMTYYDAQGINEEDEDEDGEGEEGDDGEGEEEVEDYEEYDEDGGEYGHPPVLLGDEDDEEDEEEEP